MLRFIPPLALPWITLPSGLVLAVALTPLATAAQQVGEPEPVPAGRAADPGTYAADGMDVRHYDIEIALPRGAGEVWGVTGIDLRAEATLDTLRFDFTGLAIERITIDGTAAPGWRHEEGVLWVALATPLQPSSAARVEISYRGQPDDGLIVGQTVHDRPAAFVDNWPNRARFWFPSADHPSDKATARLTVHAPAEWQVIANGRRIGQPFPTPSEISGPDVGPRRTWIYQTDVELPTYTLVVGGAELEIDTVGLAACGSAPASRRTDGCIEVTTWLYPEDAESGRSSFVRAAEMVDFFTDVIGPFPYEKLAHVQSSTRFGGMENASAIFYDQGAIAQGINIEGTVSHETAHQWFGDSVTEADWSELWLSEGFATYFGAVFFEYADGRADFDRRMAEVRQRYLTSADTLRPVIERRDNLFELLNRNNYQKGAAVLHMLRSQVGDDAFFAGVARYFERHRDATATTDDFRAVIEEASGQQLGWFFEQWLERPGYPVLRVTRTPLAGGGLALDIDQIQFDAAPRFRLPLTLEFTAPDGPQRTQLWLEAESSQRFELPQISADAAVTLDPDAVLLMRTVEAAAPTPASPADARGISLKNP